MHERDGGRKVLRASWAVRCKALALALPVSVLGLVLLTDAEIPTRFRVGGLMVSVVVLTALARWALSYVSVSPDLVVVSGPIVTTRVSRSQVVGAHLTHGWRPMPEVRLDGGRRLRISFLVEGRARQLVDTLGLDTLGLDGPVALVRGAPPGR